MSNLKNPSKPTQHRHASYGMVGFSRTNGNSRRLFGSALKSHYSTIRMKITPAIMEHDLHADQYFTAGNSAVIEIELSATQFAEAITSMNIGDGVPCTIRRLNGKLIDDPPDIETEVERIKSEFEGDLTNMITAMKERRADIEKLTAKLPEKAKRDIHIALDVILQQVTSNVPFIMEQFNEASDRVVTSAKRDIEAFALHALHMAGLDAIADGRVPKQLATPRDDYPDDANVVDQRRTPCANCFEYGECSIHPREKRK